MAEAKGLLSGRKVTVYVELAAAILALGGAVYYAVQSNADGCFNAVYLVLMICGVAAVAVHVCTRLEFFGPVAGVLFGVAVGIIVHDMLPTMSDVWNGVHFIGGNLTAYIVYTAISLVTAVAVIACCFIGIEKAE